MKSINKPKVNMMTTEKVSKEIAKIHGEINFYKSYLLLFTAFQSTPIAVYLQENKKTIFKN